jgi:hypothetical protein
VKREGGLARYRVAGRGWSGRRACLTGRVTALIQSAVVLGFVFLFVISRPALADPEAEALLVRLSAKNDNATVSFDVSNAFTTDFREQLKNGLVRRATIEVELLEATGLLRRQTRRCTFKKDVWDEYLQTRIEDGPAPAQVKNHRVIASSVETCGKVESLALVQLRRLRATRTYQVRVTVRLNPVSEADRRRARRFMSNPRAQRQNNTRSFFDVIFGLNRNQSNDTFVFISSRLRRPEPKK